MNNLEILAPAGDIECAKAAINAGADAVYLGLKNFSARDGAENFDGDSLKKVCSFAAAHGVKVYAALNTVVKDSEIAPFLEEAGTAAKAGCDALILQDVFLGSLIKEQNPGLCLHLSTQAGACNEYAAYLARDCGFSRIILPRETAAEDIEKMTGIIECEAFVQGALCTCFSGQCYFSSFVGGNSGNRGRCRQPCRKSYSWDRVGYDTQAYRLSTSDLCVGTEIDRLISYGVTSFKIEGRMRSPEYVAAAVIYYRDILDHCDAEDDLSALKRTYNRGNYTRGLTFGQDRNFLFPDVQGHIGEEIGHVTYRGGRPFCETDEPAEEGDGFKILRDGCEVGGAAFGGRESGGFYLFSPEKLKYGDSVRITRDTSLTRDLLSTERRISFKADVYLGPGVPGRVVMDGFEVEGDDVLSEAKTRPVQERDVTECFLKTDRYPYSVEIVPHVGNCFVPRSVMNALRRKAYAEYWEHISEKKGMSFVPKIKYAETAPAGKNTATAVIARSLDGADFDIGILKLYSFDSFDRSLFGDFRGEKFLYLPAYMSGDDLEKAAALIPFFDGIYSDGIWAVNFAEMTGADLFAGTGFNITNSASLSCVPAKYIALSKELTCSEAEAMSSDNTFCLTCGDIKIMDLVYCPFSRECDTCDMRETYRLTDGEGRVFPARRYLFSGCRFELFNCAELVSANTFTGRLADCTMGPVVSAEDTGNTERLKEIYPSHTKGHSEDPVI